MALNSEQLASGILIAYSLFSQGRYGDTETVVEGLLTLDPDNSYLNSMLACTFHLQNRLEEALSAYTRAIELLPDDTSSLVNRGEIYLKRGNLSQAAADFKRAVDLDESRQDPFANRARLLLQMTSGALKLALEKGTDALEETKQQIEKQLNSPEQ